MRTVRVLYYTDHHEFPLPPGHRFPIRKYRLTRELLARDGLYDFIPAPLADRTVLDLVHDRNYVEQFLSGTLSAQAIRRIGFPWSPELVSRTLAGVGGTLAATRDALAQGFGGTLAGGTHHAFRAEGSGFCVFNDIAVALLWARNEAGARRAVVIDLDVHQGDGTAQIFADDADVLTISVHGNSNFPFRKQNSRIDVGLADETGDEEYLSALRALLPRIDEFAPEIVFYQSGVDGLACDRLGRLALTHAGLEQRDRIVMEFCSERQLPLIVTLGGGYGDPIEATAEAHANTFLVAAQVFGNRPSERDSAVAERLRNPSLPPR
jgi:acetoin utilization deacetylase AcuC-like enzyme